MTPMKKTVLVRLAILALVAAVGFFVLVVTIPQPPATKRNLARIDGTMTELNGASSVGSTRAGCASSPQDVDDRLAVGPIL